MYFCTFIYIYVALSDIANRTKATREATRKSLYEVLKSQMLVNIIIRVKKASWEK